MTVLNQTDPLRPAHEMSPTIHDLPNNENAESAPLAEQETQCAAQEYQQVEYLVEMLRKLGHHPDQQG